MDDERLVHSSEVTAGGAGTATSSVAGMNVPATSDVIRPCSAGDVLAMVPYLLGFHPSDSLVALGLDEPRNRVRATARIDLAPDPQGRRQLAEALLTLLVRNDITRVLLAAFCADARLADPGVATARAAFGAAGIEVVDAWRCDGRRWWSYLCSDPACCPASGTPYDPTANPCAAEAVVRGLAALPDRAALEASVARVGGAVRRRMAAETQRARNGILAAVLACDDPRAGFVTTGQDEVVAFVREFVGQPRQLAEAEAARLTVWLQHIHVRDAAWCLVQPPNLEPHVDLWLQVTRLAVPGLVAAPAALLAFTAWRIGRGALAQCALDRALADDPHYSLAGIMNDVLTQGLPPSAWTPSSLAELYAATRPTGTVRGCR